MSSHFKLQFLHEIKIIFDDFCFRGFVLKLSFIIYYFPQFLSLISCPIWSISKNTSRISFFPFGFDPYLPLYPSIRCNFLKLVSLVLFLTRDRVKSTTSRFHLVSGLEDHPRLHWFGVDYLSFWHHTFSEWFCRVVVAILRHRLDEFDCVFFIFALEGAATCCI